MSRVEHIDIVADTDKSLHSGLGCLQLGCKLLLPAGLVGCVVA